MNEIEQCIVSAVKRLAEENPDFIYTREDKQLPEYEDGKNIGTGGCYYWPTVNNPMGCIVGAAMTDCNIPLPNVGSVKAGLNATQVIPEDFKVRGTVKDWLREVQTNQDKGYTWGKAVKLAGEPRV